MIGLIGDSSILLSISTICCNKEENLASYKYPVGKGEVLDQPYVIVAL